MKILFCQDPLDTKSVDFSYEEEFLAAKKAGFDVGLINLEALLYEDKPKKAIKNITLCEEKEGAIYRGWMITPKQYNDLYSALKEKNVFLINTPEEYKHCHYLPESYSLIKDHTPKTVIIENDKINDFEFIKEKISVFGDKALIIKDYVKSRKHEWQDACFIPNTSDIENLKRVTETFVKRQGNDLNEGLVYREFLTFESIGNHPKSNMPLTNEHRIFFFNNECVFCTHYWEEVDYKEDNIPLEKFKEIAKKIKSNFFTMDIAKCSDGSWIIVELGDGQVAGLPSEKNAEKFYKALKS